MGTFPLALGDNLIDITVTTEDDTVKTYTINVTREGNVNLASLELEGEHHGIGFRFDKDILEYRVSSSYNITKVNVIATPEDSLASVLIEGGPELSVGSNIITITVSYPLVGNQNVYTVDLIRLKPVYLKTLELTSGCVISPPFDKEIFRYTMEVPYEATAIKVNAVPEHEGTSVYVSGNSGFDVGKNRVRIMLRDPDENITFYYIYVTRAPARDNANLQSL
jgi:hypothetical protein